LSCFDLDRLATDLANPPLHLSITELADLWTYERIRAICPVPRGLQDYPELSLRMRGAFGTALFDMPAKVTKSGFRRARAWDVLFAPIVMMSPGLEVPRPAIVRADVTGGKLIVDVHLFGDAMAWRDDAALALLLALRGGVALSAGGRLRVSVEPDDVVLSRICGVRPIEGVKWAAMRLRTPASVRHGRQTINDPLALARSCVRRVQAMACWQGVHVEADLAATSGIVADDRDLLRYQWARHSRRSGDKAIPMAGHLGRLVLTGSLAKLTPWLMLAATCNTGSHAGLGLGWFELDLT
jgi:hypothetical protein